jgi:hypothetical protein
MGRQPHALTEETLGAWLVKAAPAGLPMTEVVRTGFASVTSRCVRPSYRTALVRAGQPVLLWLSGRDPDHPSGIHAHGRTTGPATDEMPVRLEAVDPVVTREQVLAVPGLARAEVLRMPAGSNPSYLDVDQYRALQAAFPHLVQR